MDMMATPPVHDLIEHPKPIQNLHVTSNYSHGAPFLEVLTLGE
jgi:hypothetical protein